MMSFNRQDQLKLEEPLLRVTHESMRKTFKQAQKHIERDSQAIDKQLANSISQAKSGGASSEATINQLDLIEQRLLGLKRRLVSLGEEQQSHVSKLRARVDFLQQLSAINSLDSPKFEDYCRTRLDILLVDYFLRHGNLETAKKHAESRGVELLVDIDVLLQCTTIENSLRARSTQECLAWCQDNKSQLKRIGNHLEFQVRLQYYIELIRLGKKSEAIQYYRKYLVKNCATHWQDIMHAASLIAFTPDTEVPQYKKLYDSSRWDYLVEQFVSTFYTLHGLPMYSQLNECLATGISALKTHACHFSDNNHVNNGGDNNGDGSKPPVKVPREMSRAYMCPVCSKELNQLAKSLPYSHRIKSHVDPDCIVLPNYHIYGLARLKSFNRKEGNGLEVILDPVTGELFDPNDIGVVFPT